ncbi:hypothetical protein ACFO9E_18145 [Streptomyces maoxianensis]|uniref:Tail assembly chaperone n=1 Tax=Streptomyces maoxianensis TaxID=1459942 RepID=A0ABV9G649_9ACTN
MGYVPKRKRYHLDFTGTDLDGLEVTLHGLSIGEFLEIQKLRGLENGDADDSDSLVKQFADHLVAWNVTTEDGTPVEPTLAAVAGQDIDFVLTIINAWIRALTGVSVPLENGSTSGQQSPEELIATESLSPSLAS